MTRATTVRLRVLHRAATMFWLLNVQSKTLMEEGCFCVIFKMKMWPTEQNLSQLGLLRGTLVMSKSSCTQDIVRWLGLSY